MGDVRSGALTALIGPAATAVVGGIMAVGVAVAGGLFFTKLRKLDKINDAAASR
jgi:hypothetical protein